MHDLTQLIMGNELKQRIGWFITLRWLAVVIVFFVITTVRYVLEIPVPSAPLYAGNAVLALYNALFMAYLGRLNGEEDDQAWFRKANWFANAQISLDLLMLTYLLHFSGGIENPFAFYFVFHIIIASIILSNRAAYLQATLAIALFGLNAAGEYAGLMPHYHLGVFLAQEHDANPVYPSGIFFVFMTTMYLTAYMASSTVNKLRAKEIELAVANARIAEQDRLKSRYVLTVSHDLQSSLAGIQSCLKVVVDGLTGPLPPKAMEMVGRAEQRAQHLLRFIKDLLDLSRIKASRELVMKECDLGKLIDDVVSQLKPRAEAKRIAVELRIPERLPPLVADPDAVEKLFMNLLSNAVRYTPEGGTVGVLVEGPAADAACFRAEVWDTGIGIPPADIAKVFDEFYRAKNAEELIKEGTGLGLSIVKEVVRAHGGTVRVESEMGKGSRFILTLSANA